jgi:hypothetical protein
MNAQNEYKTGEYRGDLEEELSVVLLIFIFIFHVE